MLEKIGLPAKPSLRGSNWVVDASHCQGCSSQFTFINRKHHCRRCGGLFCNNCTQKRMVLRGQGDSPVRICEPCNKQNEAARYEMRYRHKNKSTKGGSSTAASKNMDEIPNELFPGSSKEFAETEEVASSDGAGDEVRKVDADDCTISHDEGRHGSPKELRQQALEQKNRYKTLKADGQSAEALKAFKRAKELDRLAAAVELQLRKERKKALSASGTVHTQISEDDSPEPTKKAQPQNLKGKRKDDLTGELKSLGWSDLDLHDVEKKPANLEREFLNLMGDTSNGTDQKTGCGVDISEVTSLKKKALMLKRNGKLAEAKEELRRAKLLEKQLEEQELLAGDDDSDDEIYALIRSMDADKHDKLTLGSDTYSGFKLDDLVGDGGDLGIGSNFEVTDDDMDDPGLVAALHSIGWTEDHIVPQPISINRVTLEQEILDLKKQAVNQQHSGEVLPGLGTMVASDVDGVEAPTARRTSLASKPAPKSRSAIQRELLALKKKALALRKEGKVDEAEEQLKKGKVLEQQLEEIDNAPNTLQNEAIHVSAALPSTVECDGDITEQDMHDPAYLILLKSLGWEDEENGAKKFVSVESGKISASPSENGPVVEKRSKAEIQRELLRLKRKAFALRRQGQASEASEALNDAKELESQLKEKETAEEAQPVTYFSESVVEMGLGKKEATIKMEFGSEEDATEPSPVDTSKKTKDNGGRRDESVNVLSPNLYPNQSSSGDTKTSIQQEIINHKRKAIALKREGRLAEAREELRKAKLLEQTTEQAGVKPLGFATSSSNTEVCTPSPSPVMQEFRPHKATPKTMSSQERCKIQRQCLNHKRNAMKLRREGRIDEAEAEYQLAKNLEVLLEDASSHQPPDSWAEDVGMSDDFGVVGLLDPQISAALKELGLPVIYGMSSEPVRPEPFASEPRWERESSSQERAQLEAEIKAEKVKALQLKRFGNQTEALDALRKAKQLEKKLSSLH